MNSKLFYFLKQGFFGVKKIHKLTKLYNKYYLKKDLLFTNFHYTTQKPEQSLSKKKSYRKQIL